MGQKILLIDDDEGYLLAVRRMLEGSGYAVRSASSAEQARQELKSETPDLILLDVIMPNEDGLAFAEELSRSETIADVPVVLVTAVAESQGQMMSAFEQGKGLSAVDVLPKSEVHGRLLECVTSALGEREDAGASQPDA